MRIVKAQYLLSFSVMGAALAYLPLFLRSRLADQTQVGLVMSTTGIAIILTPVLMTFLADTRVQSRWLIAGSFGLTAGALGWLLFSHGLIALLIAHTVFAFAFWPQTALQDGVFFALNRQRERDSKPTAAYHRVRFYGTLGFALPLGGLYFLIGEGDGAEAALVLGGIFAVLGLLNALLLPHIPLAQARNARFDENETDRLPHPTLAAARALFRGPGLIFAIGLFVAHLANTAYYSFYSIYLEEQVGFATKWVGPIIMLGVILEIGVMLAVGKMTGRFGIKGVLLLGLAMQATRFAMLGLAPTPAVAVATQLLHGMAVIAMFVIPPIYLNQLAGGAGGDHFRASIQGLYAMAVFGPSRIVGNVLAGVLADVSQLVLFNVCAGVTAVAIVFLAVGFKPQQRRHLLP